MRNIAIIALLLACVSLVDSAENMKEFDLMEQENMNIWQAVVSGVRNIS